MNKTEREIYEHDAAALKITGHEKMSLPELKQAVERRIAALESEQELYWKLKNNRNKQMSLFQEKRG